MAKPAQVLLVRFKSALPVDEMIRVLESRMEAFRALTGLRQKYYLKDSTTGEIAGLYLWDSPESLADYGKSELRATIAKAYQAVGAPRVEVYEVMKVLREERV